MRSLVVGSSLLLLALGPGLSFRAEAMPPFWGTIFLDPEIITPSDPTTFLGATYAGRGLRLMFDRRVNGWVWKDAYLFDAIYEDGLDAEIQVNPEFGSTDAAEAEALKYGEAVGRLPTSLRANVQTMWIHKGVEPFGGGNNNLLIHTGQADLYVQDGILEETFVHEAAHTSLDATHAAAPGWLAAQNADPDFISSYAESFPTREDIAESFLPWLALRYRRERISASLADTFEQTIPNRIAYFDAQTFDMHPLSQAGCGNGTVEADEECDDGNTADGDCCSATCSAEPPAPACRAGWGKASLVVSETRTGKEKIKAMLKRGPALPASEYGDAVAGTTAVSVCVHDDADRLAVLFTVARPGDSCGAKKCWKSLGGKGFLYKDKLASSAGVGQLKLVAGGPGKSQILLKAANNESRGQTAMPTGVAAALTGSTSATLQVHVSDGSCFEATLDDVKEARPLSFRANN